MNMLKFISYKTCNIVNVVLSNEFDSDIIPQKIKHEDLIKKIMSQGCRDENLLSYGCCIIINNTIKIVHNDYFYSYSERCDEMIKRKVYMEWSFKQKDEGLSELGKQLNQEMR